MIILGHPGGVVIFDSDLMIVPHGKIMSTRVKITTVGGRIVYRKSNIPPKIIVRGDCPAF